MIVMLKNFALTSKEHARIDLKSVSVLEHAAFRRMMYLIGFIGYSFDVPTYITQTEFPNLKMKMNDLFLVEYDSLLLQNTFC